MLSHLSPCYDTHRWLCVSVSALIHTNTWRLQYTQFNTDRPGHVTAAHFCQKEYGVKKAGSPWVFKFSPLSNVLACLVGWKTPAWGGGSDRAVSKLLTFSGGLRPASVFWGLLVRRVLRSTPVVVRADIWVWHQLWGLSSVWCQTSMMVIYRSGRLLNGMSKLFIRAENPPSKKKELHSVAFYLVFELFCWTMSVNSWTQQSMKATNSQYLTCFR